MKTLDELRAERLQNSDPPETRKGEEANLATTVGGRMKVKKVVLNRRKIQPIYTSTSADSNSKPESRLGARHSTKRSSGIGMGTTETKRRKLQHKTKRSEGLTPIQHEYDSGADVDVVGVSTMEERKLSIAELKTEM